MPKILKKANSHKNYLWVPAFCGVVPWPHSLQQIRPFAPLGAYRAQFYGRPLRKRPEICQDPTGSKEFGPVNASTPSPGLFAPRSLSIHCLHLQPDNTTPSVFVYSAAEFDL